MTLGNTFSNESKSFDLREFQALKSARVYTTRAGKVHNDINVRVLVNSLLEAGVDREESFLGSPVELLDVMTTERIDHGSDGRGFTTAGVVEVKHSLDSTGLETIHE